MSTRSPEKIKLFELNAGDLRELFEDEICFGYEFRSEQAFFVSASEPEVVLV